MIDFAALVLGPAMVVFAQPFTLTPVASQPGVVAYQARGSYASKPVQVPIEGSDLYHQTQQPTLGIRLSEFQVAPAQGDTIVMAQGAFQIFNIEFDGQGGADLQLRELDRQ